MTGALEMRYLGARLSKMLSDVLRRADFDLYRFESTNSYLLTWSSSLIKSWIIETSNVFEASPRSSRIDPPPVSKVSYAPLAEIISSAESSMTADSSAFWSKAS